MIFGMIFVHCDSYGLVNIRALYINAELWLILRTFKMLLMILSMILNSCQNMTQRFAAKPLLEG
jgi:hypothetical protein